MIKILEIRLAECIKSGRLTSLKSTLSSLPLFFSGLFSLFHLMFLTRLRGLSLLSRGADKMARESFI